MAITGRFGSVVSSCLFVLASLALARAAAGQSSFFSATGTFSAQTGASADFQLYFTNAHPRNTTFETFAWFGGTNAAGDLIVPGGIDSIIEVFSSGGSSLGYNDDSGMGQRDSLLSPDGFGLTYLPPLGAGTHRLNLTASDYQIGDGHWAVDMTREGTFWLENLVGTSSSFGSLTIGSDTPGGAVVRLGGAMNIAGRIEIRAGGVLDAVNGTVRVSAASLAGDGRIDLHDNDMIVDYAGDSPIDTVKSYIAAAYTNGTWSGSGITSSAAAAGPTGRYALGYGEASVLNLTSFSGQEVDETTVLVKYTYAGDATLDGKVDVGDLGALASNWQQAGLWTAGDFNYDGSVNVGDLGILATNWQQGVTTPALGPDLAEALASLGLSGASIPEPACCVLFGSLIGVILLRDRRCRFTCDETRCTGTTAVCPRA